MICENCDIFPAEFLLVAKEIDNDQEVVTFELCQLCKNKISRELKRQGSSVNEFN